MLRGYFFPSWCRSSHSAAACSITSEAVVSRSAAADLILLMISGSIDVRSFSTPGGGFTGESGGRTSRPTGT